MTERDSSNDRNAPTRRTFLRGGAATLATTVLGSAVSAAAEQRSEGSSAKTASVEPSPTPMPSGRIGNVKLSRLILGSNLMTGYSHARDLSGYANELFRQYNTDEKVLETLAIAEAEGINAILQGEGRLLRRYNEERNGHIGRIQALRIKPEDDHKSIRQKIRAAADEKPNMLLYIHGVSSDLLVWRGHTDLIGTALKIARDENVTLGIGGHSLRVVEECEDRDYTPDFYVKTFHHDQYWSAIPKANRESFCWYKGYHSEHNRWNDNMWCLDAERHIRVMRWVTVPWIAYKVLAAGAIEPKDGFSYAFQNGADFIAVGMFDFQVRHDAGLVKKHLRPLPMRDRRWCG